MSLQIASPFQQFFDRDGSPLDNGFVYIGTANLNPETNPLTVYFDDALTIPAAQPLRTSNGYIVRNGSPARVYTSQEDFSLTAREKNGVLVFTVADATSLSNLQSQLAAGSGSSLVGYNQGGSGAVDRTVQSRLRDYVSVKDFGAVGDNVADDTIAIQAALTFGGTNNKGIFFPAGTYLLTAGLSCGPTMLEGEGAGITRLNFNLPTPGANLIDFAASTDFGRLAGVKGIEIICSGANGGYGIKTPKQADQYLPYERRYQFHDVVCRGGTINGSAHGTTYNETCEDGWIYIGDCTFCQVSHIKINGSFDISSAPFGQVEDRGVILDAAGAILTARIQDLEISSLYIGVEPIDRAFYSIMNFDIIATYRGIYQFPGATIFSEPKIGFGNINSQDVGIYLENCNARDIASVTIRRHPNGWPLATNDWYGVKLNNVDESNVRSCHIEHGSITTFAGGDIIGIYADNASGALKFCDNLFGEKTDYAVILDNVSGFVIENSLLSSATPMTYFRALNNTRSGVVNGAASSSFAVAHVWLEDDGSVDWSTITENVRGIERLPKESTVTIASGEITVSKSYHAVATEGGAATDDLVAINPPTVAADGMRLELRAADSDDTVVLKDGTGNLRLPADFSLTHSDDWIVLVYENNVWKQIASSDNTA